jgi:hypothetical protein
MHSVSGHHQLRVRALYWIALVFITGADRTWAADPPPLSGPITKCDVMMEYLSDVKSTGRKPPFSLTNLLRNKGVKAVTDVAWRKPDLATRELGAGRVLEESYPVSAFVHDKDAPILYWYQGCNVPAEAYIVRVNDEKSDRDFSLRSLLRLFSEAGPPNTESAQIVVSMVSDSIQFEITRTPANIQVGLTGIAPWITSNSSSAAAASAREYGYTSIITKPNEVLKREELERVGGEWRFQDALFTHRVTGERNDLRIRLPASTAGVRMTRATIILARADGSLIATGSYATFAPDR